MTLDPTTASSLTEDQAIGVARFAVEKRAPGWQAFEVLLRAHEELVACRRSLARVGQAIDVMAASSDYESRGCADMVYDAVWGTRRTRFGARINGGK